MTQESTFKQQLIRQIQMNFPGAIVLKADANYLQGIPDHIVLWKEKWAAFEAKRSLNSPHQKNQDYYVKLLNTMSLSAFVYPENQEWFLDELQQSFRYSRTTRLARRK